MQKYTCFEEVQSVEKEIFSLVKFVVFHLKDEEKRKLLTLLEKRKRLLNQCCLPTEENCLALRQINQEIVSLSEMNLKRAKEMRRFVSTLPAPMKASNWYIMSYLRLDGYEGGITLSDDAAYGSDFCRMRKLLDHVEEGISFKPFNQMELFFGCLDIYPDDVVETLRLTDWYDDEEDEYLFHQRFLVTTEGCEWVRCEERSISLPLHELLRFVGMSVPDVLRLRHCFEADVEWVSCN